VASLHRLKELIPSKAEISIPKDHPLATEMLSLCGDTTPQGQAKLLDLLKQVGYDCRNPFNFESKTGSIHNSNGDILLLSSVDKQGNFLRSRTSFNFYGDILVLNRAFPYAEALITCADTIDAWNQSSVVDSSGKLEYSQTRTSSHALICGETIPKFSLFEKSIETVIHDAINFYISTNAFVKVVSDEGFQLLRYEVGEKFDAHVDAITGHSDHSLRQLTVILYLNDNYTGGETYFPRQNLLLKPQPGSIVIFPSFYTHPHAGLPVEVGTKYVVVTWFC